MTDNTPYRLAPAHILDAIHSYAAFKKRPGGFVQALLRNDLMGAYRAADQPSLRGLGDVLRYLHREVPHSCWGSAATVEEWLTNAPGRAQMDAELDLIEAEAEAERATP